MGTDRQTDDTEANTIARPLDLFLLLSDGLKIKGLFKKDLKRKLEFKQLESF
jgi:hypothetical protein